MKIQTVGQTQLPAALAVSRGTLEDVDVFRLPVVPCHAAWAVIVPDVDDVIVGEAGVDPQGKPLGRIPGPRRTPVLPAVLLVETVLWPQVERVGQAAQLVVAPGVGVPVQAYGGFVP